MRHAFFGFLTGAFAFAAPLASADEVAEAGRKILDQYKDAVVTVQLVIKQQFSMGRNTQDNESKTEATGTVISPDGLTVVSLSETDPSSIMETMMGGQQDFSITSEVQDVKILKANGTEVAAEVILRDKELDIAYVRPVEKAEEEFAYIDFSDAGHPQLLDEVISLSRLGRVGRREPAASVERINAVIEKPRTLYIPGNDPTQTALGSPAFTLDGKPIGLFLVRVIQDTGGGGGGMFGNFTDNVATVLLPAQDVIDGAAQVPPYAETE
ncbi:MAG: trypsin-like peptidase domain-containing protein [Candidatus Hydrogenedentales bacterium]